MKKENKGMKQLVLGMAAYTSASILGPLIIFVSIGHVVDKAAGTRLLYKLVGLGLAFIFTNLLLMKKVRKLNGIMEEYGLEKQKEKEAAVKKLRDKE